MVLQLPKACRFQAVSPPEHAYDDLVSVHLLGDDTSISALRDTLIFHSGHFAELFDDDPDRRTIVVPDISATLFAVVECWLRTGSLLPPLPACLSYADMVTIYVFGDTYEMPRLRNAIVDVVFGTIFDEQLFPISSLNDMYSRTRPYCSLRFLLVNIAIAVYSSEDLMLKSELLPKEFLIEVLQAIRGKTVRLGLIMFPVEVWHTTVIESLCNWHEHVDPAQYTWGDADPGNSEVERIHSEGCESKDLDYGEPDGGEVDQSWHSALVMRSR